MFSVIVPTHNRREKLRRCLGALSRQDYPSYEVIVVDDASTDDTRAMVAEEFANVQYLYQRNNLGSAAARNYGMRAAVGDIVAFTDDDCVPPLDWLASHHIHYADPQIGAVGGPQVPPNPNFFDKFDRARYMEQYYTEIKRVGQLQAWEGLATSNMSIRRSIFDLVGYFDESFLTGSDPELVRRMVQQTNYEFIVDPSLRVTHLKVHTLTSYLKMRFRRGCGSILTDVKESTLKVRRFLPVPNVIRSWQEWHSYRYAFDGGISDFLKFWTLTLVVRWVEVTGRLYYYLKVGR